MRRGLRGSFEKKGRIAISLLTDCYNERNAKQSTHAVGNELQQQNELPTLVHRMTVTTTKTSLPDAIEIDDRATPRNAEPSMNQTVGGIPFD
jgi:hypothetical protein